MTDVLKGRNAYIYIVIIRRQTNTYIIANVTRYEDCISTFPRMSIITKEYLKDNANSNLYTCAFLVGDVFCFFALFCFLAFTR